MCQNYPKRVEILRKTVTLACSECLSRNYSTAKNANQTQRLETNKFCKRCDKHTVHRETK
ncbi:50S ribosomal protein L33 [Terribacillus halophilus]|uniref:50S ribosomal protein L33 n=1 Tax=Terribacillus halophilus TaxID=361279 RepID=UPI000986492D